MEEISKPESLARAIRGLTIVVGLLALVSLAQFGIWAFSFYRTTRMLQGSPSSYTTSDRGAGPPTRAGVPPSSGKSFSRLSPEEKIKAAVSILLTKNVQAEGKLKSIVVEILKQSPGTAPRYAVGEEIPEMARYGGDEATYGEGMVVLFVGSQDEMRESATYRDGRIGAFGDMPLTTLRALASGKPVSASPEGPSGKAGVPAAASAPADPAREVLIETSTSAEGVTREFSISRGTALGTPEWLPENGEPPLAVSKAIHVAAAAAQSQSPGHPSYVVRSVRLGMIGCDQPVGNRWYYNLDCYPSRSPVAFGRSIPIVVLMDGSVVTGRVTS